MLGATHPHRPRVVRLLEATRDAMAVSRVEPFALADSLGLELILRCRRDGYERGDITNYLGGIADVLQARRVNANITHLGELAKIYVYPDDRQIHEIHCQLLQNKVESYMVLLWRLSGDKSTPVGAKIT